MDNLTLADTLHMRPHYLTAIYQAMREYIDNHPELPDRSPARLQMIEIRDKAERDFNLWHNGRA